MESGQGRFAVESVFWRRVIDWSVKHVSAIFHRLLIWISAFCFFFVASPARKALLQNLRLIRPDSWRILNYFRALRVFVNFGWSLTDAATYRILRPLFRYVLEGERFLEQLASGKGAIVLTAHMGNYDLGAALFAQRFHRKMKIVRAPEPDALSAQHVDLALQQSTGGVVRVGYSGTGPSLAFDLLNELRSGEIICIQGDRVVGDVAHAPVRIFNRAVSLPNGPFVLSLVSAIPVYPLFIVRTGWRKYRIIAREPIICARGDASRDQAVAEAMERWSQVLEEVLRNYWPQWFAFVPLTSTSSSAQSSS